MSKYIEHEVDRYITSVFRNIHTGLPYTVVITNGDNYNQIPYLFYSNSTTLDTPCEEMSVISFDGEILKGYPEDIIFIREWIFSNKEILEQYWNDEISSFDFIDSMKKI